MKGLLVKELYILKKDYMIIFVMFTLMTVAMTKLVINHDHADAGEFWGSMNGMCVAFCGMTIGMMTSSFRYDSRCGHTQYSLITPVSRRDYVWSKLIILAASSVLSGIWLYTLTFVTYAVSGISITATDAAKGAFITLIMVIVSLYGGIMSIYYHIKKGEDGWVFPWCLLFIIEITAFMGFILRFSAGRKISPVFYVLFAIYTFLTVYYFKGCFRASEEMEF